MKYNLILKIYAMLKYLILSFFPIIAFADAENSAFVPFEGITTGKLLGFLIAYLVIIIAFAVLLPWLRARYSFQKKIEQDFENKYQEQMKTSRGESSVMMNNTSIINTSGKGGLPIIMEDNALASLAYPAWFRNEQQKIIAVNQLYQNLLGDDWQKYIDKLNKAQEQSRNAISNNKYQELIELSRNSESLALKAMQSCEAQQIKEQIIVAGQRQLYQITENPAPDNCIFNNQLVKTIGIAVSLPEEEKLRDKAERQSALQKDLLENSATAMAVYSAEMQLRYYNHSFVQLWGLDEKFLDNYPYYNEILDLLKEKRKLPEHADFTAFKRQQQELFTKLLQSHQEYYYLPDGRTLRVMIIPHTYGGLLFSYDDVTENLALQRSHNTLIAVQRATIDNLQEAIAVFGEDGRLQLCNQLYAALWDLPVEWLANNPHINDILQRTQNLYSKPKPLNIDDEAHSDISLQDEIENAVMNSVEFELKNWIALLTTHEYNSGRLQLSDGSYFHWIITPLPDGASMISYQNITDSVKAERRLRERNQALARSEKFRSSFLADISQELRTPLTAVIGYSEMLKISSNNNEHDKSQPPNLYIDNIYNASLNIKKLLDDIVDVASLETGYSNLELGEHNLHKMLQEICDDLQDKTEELGKKLLLNCQENIGDYYFDYQRLGHVLRYLIVYEAEFNRYHDIVLGAAITEDGFMLIWVGDNDLRVNTARRFRSQLVNTDKYIEKKNAGLGLGLVKRIIMLHNGYIEHDINLVRLYLPTKKDGVLKS